LSYLRIWDRLAADRPDYLIANSQYTQARIKKYYRRDSIVIYPPVEINGDSVSIMETESPGTKYFLVVSRLSSYKKIDVIIEAFNKLNLPLVVVGEGNQKKYLKKIAKKNIKFLGWRSDEDLKRYIPEPEPLFFLPWTILASLRWKLWPTARRL